MPVIQVVVCGETGFLLIEPNNIIEAFQMKGFFITNQ